MQLWFKKENSEFKPALLHLKTDSMTEVLFSFKKSN